MSKKFFRNWIVVSAFLLAMSALSGCVLVPFINMFKQTGATESDRQTLLGEGVEEFNRALQYGQTMKAIAYVRRFDKEDEPEKAAKAEETAQSIIDSIRESRRDERIVDSKVDYMNFNDGAREADVEVVVRYFRAPQYIVKERIEKQRWEFIGGGEWRIVSRTVEPLKPREASPMGLG